MYKASCVAVLLLATLVLTSGSRTAGAAANAPSSPLIIVKGKLVNQTGPVPTTKIFTPTQDGLYRLSVYGTNTVADPSSNSVSAYFLNWTDSSGVLGTQLVIQGGGWQNGPWQYYPQYPISFQALAGQPVSYSVMPQGGPADGSIYTLYWTVERLE
jgi:hypothetical protein